MGCNYHNYQDTFITVFIIIHYQPPHYPRCHYKYLYQPPSQHIDPRPGSTKADISAVPRISPSSAPGRWSAVAAVWDKYLCIPMGDNLHWLAAGALGTTVKCVSEKNALHLLYICCIKGMSTIFTIF